MTANSISLQNCAIHRVRFELWIFCKISSQCHNYIFCLNKYRNTQIINDNISENNFTSKKQRSEILRPKERIKILFWNLSVSQFSRLGSSPFVLQISSNLCQEHFLWSDLCATTPIFRNVSHVSQFIYEAQFIYKPRKWPTFKYCSKLRNFNYINQNRFLFL